MLSGVLVFALPITVIGTKFTNIVRDIEKVMCSNNLLVVGACFGFKLSRFGSVKWQETAKKQELEYVGEAMSSRSTIASGLNNHHRVTVLLIRQLRSS
jgi:hypothetical protein